MAPLRFLRDSIGFAASQFVVRAMMIVRTLVAVRVLGPQAFGVWSALQILMDYGGLAPMGNQQGLDVAVPGRIVDGDPAALDRLKRSGFTNMLLLSLLYSCVCIGYFAGSSGNVMSHWGIGGLLVAMTIVVQVNWSYYAIGIMRSHGNISAVSRWYFLQGLVGALLGLALVKPLGEWGLLWGWLAGNLVAFSGALREGRSLVPFRPLLGRDSMLLIRVGLPMFVFVGSTLIIRNLDRLIILRFLGTRDLGFYSLAVTALTLIQYMPDSVTYVFYPRLVRHYRAGGDRPEAVRESVRTVLRVLTVFTPLLGGIGSLFVRDVIEVLAPNFKPGIEAVQIMCFTAAAICSSNLASIVLMTLGRQFRLIPLALVSIGAFALADILVLRHGFGITGVAWATLATYTAASLATLWLALRSLEMSAGEIARELFGSVWGLAVALVAAMLVERFGPWASEPGGLFRVLHATAGTVTLIVAYAVLVGPRLRGLGMRRVLVELDLPFLAWLRRMVNLTDPSA